DISEFESYMASQAVPSLWGIPSLQKYMRHPLGLARVTESLTSNFLNFGRKPAHFHATARSNLHETGLRAAPTALMRGPLTEVEQAANPPCAIRPSRRVHGIEHRLALMDWDWSRTGRRSMVPSDSRPLLTTFRRAGKLDLTRLCDG